MIKGRYHLATVRPRIDILGNTAWDANDILFDWHRFEIPRGACAIKSFNMIVAGLDKVATAGIDIEIFFAKSVNGVAPTSLGNPDSATTLIAMTACRTHIIGHKLLDASAMENSDTFTIGYNVWDQTAVGDQVQNQMDIVLEGDPTYPGTTTGYQSIWIAGFTLGTPNHGTTVLLNQAGDQAISTVPVALITDGGDADDVFAVGDEIMAFAADGSSPSKVGTVTAVAANLLTVNKVEEAFTDDDELCMRGPYQFNFGLEY